MNGSGTHTGAELVELSQRESDGIEVQLLWERGTDRLVVVVFDAKSETAFEVPAKPHEALEVFRHPFAYAARTSELPSLEGLHAPVAA